MTLLGLLVGIVVILFACWLVKTYLPGPWQTIALVVIVFLALGWLATIFFPNVLSLRVR